MFFNKRIELDVEKQKMSRIIFNWCQGREQILNVISPPYNSSSIFLEIILNFVSKDKKVLYITGEAENHIEIIELIKRYTDFRNYSYFRNVSNKQDSLLIVCNYTSSVNLINDFELVIYDDIRSYTEHNNFEIMDAVIKYSKDSNKLICYSVEKIFKAARELCMPVRQNKLPIMEPRVITTRLDINKEIPYVVYEYLIWSIECERRVVVFAPDKERVFNVYKYLCNFKNELSKNIFYFTKGENNYKVLSSFTKIKKGIIVTDDYEERYIDTKDIDVLVFFADDKKFSYKDLLYFCGKVGRGEQFSKGEVIFLANVGTDDMDKAKDMARNFNKEAWEMGLLRF